MVTRINNSFQNSFICKNYSIPQMITTQELPSRSHFLSCKISQVNTAKMNRSRSTASVSISSKAENDLRMNIYKKLKELSSSNTPVEDFGIKMNIINKLHKKSAENHLNQINLHSKRSKIVASKSISNVSIHRSDRNLPKSLHSFKAVMDRSTTISPVKEKLPKIEEKRTGMNKQKVRLNRLVLSPDVIPNDSNRRVYTLEELRFIYN